uniref:Reverse transcriptase domain-containing protein n=1 Tax=Tanacetum cinerariifolium TaxID=118510 RepID=A0A6L2MWE1_TANCI|nr:reverse transcriptase domain-containing protein [Tanacetum cinerariifolium]
MFGGVTDWYAEPRVATRLSLPSPLTHDFPPAIHQIVPAPPSVPRRPAILVLPSQEIPLGRPYHTQPNGVREMLTTRKRVRALLAGGLASRYPPDHSSLDHFSSDDSSSDSSSDSSLYYSSDSSSGHSLPDSSFYTPATISARPSRKRCRSPTALVPLATPTPGALAPARADLLPPRKRFRSSSATLSPEDSIEESMEIYSEEDDIDSDVMSDIEEDIAVETVAIEAAADVEVDTGFEADVGMYSDDEAEEEAESSVRGTIEIVIDKAIGLEVTEDIHAPDADKGDRETFDIGLDVVIQELMLCVERERVDSLRRHMSYTQEELRQIRMSRYYDRAEFRRLKTFAMRRLACGESSYVAKNLEPIVESEDEHGDDNGNSNGYGGGNGNGNELGEGNENGNPTTNVRGLLPIARACTYQDFLRCEPLIFKGTKGVVGPSKWFEKMETVFHISNCPQKYQELVLLCTKMVPEEEDMVEKFTEGLLNNIQGNVIVAEPTGLQDAIRIANNLMDQKLKGYATKNAENKRRFKNNSRDNRVQQPPFKRKNTGVQNVARAYTVRNSEKKGYAGSLPYCNKCKLHHEGKCTVKCTNFRKVTKSYRI